jgi:hypothetical protein
MADWIKKQYPSVCCLQETHLTDKDKHWFRMKGWEKDFPSKLTSKAGKNSYTNI